MSLVVAVGAGVGIGAGQLFFHRGRGRGICRSRRVGLFKTRAALVESRPRIVPTAVTVRDDNNNNSNSNSDNAQLIYRKGLDRAEDIQAEARAMARAANATVYSPQLLALKYNSRPIKVFFNFINYVVYNVLILCDFWL